MSPKGFPRVLIRKYVPHGQTAYGRAMTLMESRRLVIYV